MISEHMVRFTFTSQLAGMEIYVLIAEFYYQNETKRYFLTGNCDCLIETNSFFFVISPIMISNLQSVLQSVLQKVLQKRPQQSGKKTIIS